MINIQICHDPIEVEGYEVSFENDGTKIIQSLVIDFEAQTSTSGDAVYYDDVVIDFNGTAYTITLPVAVHEGYLDVVSGSGEADGESFSVTPLSLTAVVGTNTFTAVTHGHYTHESSQSGEMVTVTTNDAVIKALVVDINAEQDGTPWISPDIDKVPYQFKACPDLGHEYNREYDKIVGGTVAWNQLVLDANKDAKNTSTVDTRNNFQLAVQSVYQPIFAPLTVANVQAGDHAYVFKVTSDIGTGIRIKHNGASVDLIMYINTNISMHKGHVYMFRANFVGVDVQTIEGVDVRNMQFFDLTLAFGTAIADYAYSLEQSTAGSGVAWLKAHFPEMFSTYQPYDAGTLKSVEGLTSHDMVGKNLVPTDGWVQGQINTGGVIDNAQYSVSSPYIRLTPGTYTLSRNYPQYGDGQMAYHTYDMGKNYLSDSGWRVNPYTLTVDFECYIRLTTRAKPINLNPPNMSPSDVGTMFIVQLERGSVATAYEPYQKHSYPLDSSLTLRGIMKLDANNKPYYYGDTYESDGTVTRKYGIVDLGTLNWNYSSADTRFYTTSLTDAKYYATNVKANIVTTKYITVTFNDFYNSSSVDKTISVYTGTYVFVRDLSFTDATLFKNSLSGVYLVYEKATPTTESAQPYTNPQIVDPSGTEEYVTDSIVPVGHESRYAAEYAIVGKTQTDVYTVGFNLWDEEWELGTINSSGQNVPNNNRIRSKNLIPVIGNASYYCRSELANTSSIWALFYDSDEAVISDGFSGSWYGNINNSVFSSPNNARYIRFVAVTTTYNNDICINVSDPNRNGEYEPYRNLRYPIYLGGHTVYGGYIDVVSGLLTVTHVLVDLGSLNYIYQTAWSSNIATFYADLLDAKVVPSAEVANWYCSAYRVISANALYSGTNFSIAQNATGFRISDTGYTNAAEFKAAMSGKQLVYELATPMVYQLTPREIELFTPTMNVWSNTGDVTIDIADTFYLSDSAYQHLVYSDYVTYEGFMCGNRMRPTLPDVPLKELRIALNCGEDAVHTQPCPIDRYCDEDSNRVCEAKVCRAKTVCSCTEVFTASGETELLDNVPCLYTGYTEGLMQSVLHITFNGVTYYNVPARESRFVDMMQYGASDMTFSDYPFILVPSNPGGTLQYIVGTNESGECSITVCAPDDGEDADDDDPRPR